MSAAQSQSAANRSIAFRAMDDTAKARKALAYIAEQETSGANATVRRMAHIARDALK